jgi:hypothetical protein
LLLDEWIPGSNTDWNPQLAGRGWWGNAQTDGMPLFEMLARTYARAPERLARVAEVIERLKREGGTEADSLIPPAFLSIWKSFEAAMKQEKVS